MPTATLAAIHYGLTIFLSAFLLFQVQPIVGKMVLPWFGGSAAVWTTCMLFFQGLLLLGYLYCYWIVRFLAPRTQTSIHLSLLAASLLALPLGLGSDWRPSGGEDPTTHILLVLASSVGLPYFVLSTTGPLIQAWFARERPGAIPYRLFALSNLGSLLALLAYPVAVEPVLPIRWQSGLWSELFACFVVICTFLAWRSRHGASERPLHHADHPAAPGVATHALWIALAACPSILLLADTSYLTENIAPVPLLWVLPLSLYLLTFILCFERPGWYHRKVFLPLLAVALGALAYLPTLRISALPIVPATAINLAALFIACMACHGELAHSKPHPAHLTGYYLMLAGGGALGGLFVGVVAPYCFDGNYELSVGLVLTAVVVSVAVLRGHAFSLPIRRVAAWGTAATMVAAVAYVRFDDHTTKLNNARLSVRNFYGTLRVTSGGQGADAYRTLLHGQIVHGRQFTAPDRQDWPTTYYGPESGAGLALRTLGERRPLRVGIVGIGTGTLASYGRPQDYFRLYDIDPLVLRVARSEFTYLTRMAARSDLVLGDARLSMESEAPQSFDILLLDAFSGDSIPVHLLTREAFAVYFKHLKPKGVLAVHVSNRFLDLAPLVKAAAEDFGRLAYQVDSGRDDARQVFPSTWVLVSDNSEFFRLPHIRKALGEIAARPGQRPWSDDYSSLLAALK